jgi:hypothetical protein
MPHARPARLSLKRLGASANASKVVRGARGSMVVKGRRAQDGAPAGAGPRLTAPA